MIYNQGHSFSCGASSCYLIWQHWYVAAHDFLKQFKLTQINKESAIAWLFSARYNTPEKATDMAEELMLLSSSYSRSNGISLMLMINTYSRLVLTRVTNGL
jgi:hypothetical protein